MAKAPRQSRAKAPAKSPATKTDVTKAAQPETDTPEQEGGTKSADEHASDEFAAFVKAMPSLFCDAKGKPLDDKALATLKAHHWDAHDCDNLPAPLAMILFDASVHHGKTVANRLLQKAVGVKVDGEIDPKSRAAIDNMSLDKLEDFAAWSMRRYAFRANAATTMKDDAHRLLKIYSFAVIAATAEVLG